MCAGRASTDLPSIDVVIPTFNSGLLIDECLERIRSQNYRGKINIIIIDAGSTDETLNIARNFGCEVHVFQGMYSNGLNGARNSSLDFCKGELYWQIDSDNFVKDGDMLSNLVEPFLKIQGVNITVPLTDYLPSQANLDKWLAHNEKLKLAEMYGDGKIQGSWVIVSDMKYGITNASLLRTSILREVGGYDSDVRVLKRMREKGLSSGVIVTNCVFYHLQGQTLLKWAKKQERRILFFGKFDDYFLSKYFVATSLDHSYRRGVLNSLYGDFIIASLSILKEHKKYWYYGFLLLAASLGIFILHPYRTFRVLWKFL